MEEWVFGSAMRTYGMNDAQDPYEHEEDAMEGNAKTNSNGRRFQDTPPYFVATMRSLRVEMQGTWKIMKYWLRFWRSRIS